MSRAKWFSKVARKGNSDNKGSMTDEGKQLKRVFENDSMVTREMKRSKFAEIPKFPAEEGFVLSPPLKSSSVIQVPAFPINE
jgi:hypothetical protein